jgi:hypothetical protein
MGRLALMRHREQFQRLRDDGRALKKRYERLYQRKS